jgi:hypothetical protein
VGGIDGSSNNNNNNNHSVYTDAFSIPLHVGRIHTVLARRSIN